MPKQKRSLAHTSRGSITILSCARDFETARRDQNARHVWVFSIVSSFCWQSTFNGPTEIASRPGQTDRRRRSNRVTSRHIFGQPRDTPFSILCTTLQSVLVLATDHRHFLFRSLLIAIFCEINNLKGCVACDLQSVDFVREPRHDFRGSSGIDDHWVRYARRI